MKKNSTLLVALGAVAMMSLAATSAKADEWHGKGHGHDNGWHGYHHEVHYVQPVYRPVYYYQPVVYRPVHYYVQPQRVVYVPAPSYYTEPTGLSFNFVIK